MKVLEVKNSGKHNGWLVDCPGCGHAHVYDSRWSFNGDQEKPTFKPSYLSKMEYGEGREKRVCHSFVTDGQIKFLSDCTHELAGKTVELPDLEGDSTNYSKS